MLKFKNMSGDVVELSEEEVEKYLLKLEDKSSINIPVMERIDDTVYFLVDE